MKLATTIGPIAFLALLGCQGAVTDGSTLDEPPEVENPEETPPIPEPTGARVTDGLVALYDFSAGSGTIVTDRTGSGYALTMENPAYFEWLPGGGLSIIDGEPDAGSGLINPAPATHITGACKASNELTVEMWSRTNSYLQDGPARVIALSGNPNNRNFHIAQNYTNGYSEANARLRTTDTDNNGTPATNSLDVSVFDGLAIHHVAYTRSAAAAEGLIFLDGNIAGTLPLPGSFAEWDDSYPLTIGNEPTLDRTWRGELYLVAIYCRALSAAEIGQNMAARY